MIRQRDQFGFTLLEMLVSLSLVAIFAVLISGALRFGVKADERVYAASTDQLTLRRARAMLRDYIGSARPVWIASTDKSHVDFGGDESSLRLTAPTLLSQGGIGLSAYRFTVEDDGTFKRLLCRSQVINDVPSGGREATAVLLSNVKDFSFRYFGESLQGGAPEWQTVWNNRRALPKLIEVRASFLGTSASTWPSLVAQTFVDADVGCAIDVRTLRCHAR